MLAATIDDVQPIFNKTKKYGCIEPEYEERAIIFIHDTNLDSINGELSLLAKEGMPFHINSIEKDIRKKLVTADFNEVDKSIIEMDLERKRWESLGDSISVFEYRDLLK